MTTKACRIVVPTETQRQAKQIDRAPYKHAWGWLDDGINGKMMVMTSFYRTRPLANDDVRVRFTVPSLPYDGAMVSRDLRDQLLAFTC